MTLSCRVLTSLDADAYKALRLEGVTAFPLGFLQTAGEAASAGSADLGRTLDAGAHIGLFLDGTLIGFCGLNMGKLSQTKHLAELGPFYVSPKQQGKGHAAQLMDFAVSSAKSQGAEVVQLYVDTENHRAISFYEKKGFSLMATVKDQVKIDGVMRHDHIYFKRIA